MGIYERIQEKAAKKGISIKKLEQEVGIGNGTIKRWNTSSPQCNKIILVANYLQVPMEWLVTGKNMETGLTLEEQMLLNAYRTADPAIQTAIKKLLDISENKEKLSQSKTG